MLQEAFNFVSSLPTLQVYFGRDTKSRWSLLSGRGEIEGEREREGRDRGREREGGERGREKEREKEGERE